MKRILIIEDEPDVANTIKRYLEANGYQADFTLDAQEGLRKLEGYDLLLLDLIMPQMSGRAVLARMKDAGLDKPVIVLSAVGLPMTVSNELSQAYPGLIFISKTRMHSDLLSGIKGLIGE